MSNPDSLMNDADKTNLNGSNSGNISSNFRSTDAGLNSHRILPEAKEGTVTTGNAGVQGQSGTAATRTARGQAGEGIDDHYKK